ncbi:MAG: DUF2298 domain-containing protein [Chloroflexota bacterium]|nr:DUF2298 domain-containing protein [Chloroflexota bacterium]
MIDALVWFITVEILSLIFLPVTFLLFKRLPDRGYAFSKALSILLITFVVWLLSSIHILPNMQWAIILVVVFFAVCSFVLFWRRRSDIKEYISKNRGVIIAVEALFLGAFVLYGLVRAYNPEILYTEKPMDFAFLNAIIRTDYFPPQDPWLSGFSLNNYYFGHAIMATMAKLTGVGSAVAFNLSLALVFALASVGSFSIVYNLVRLCRGGIRVAIGFGLVAAGFLLAIGNLQGILEMFYAHGIGGEGFWSWIGIEGMNSPYQSSQWYPTEFWWWWHATRMIQVPGADYTIAEFPNFTFVLGDLHAHLLSLPFVLLSLAVCLNIFATKANLGLAWLKRNIVPFIIMIICIGSLGAIHTWDLPIYVFVFIGTIFIHAYMRRNEEGYRWWSGWMALSAIAIAGVFLCYLPFYINLKSPVTGIIPWDGPNTRPFFYFMVWGLFLFVGVSFIVSQVRSGLSGVSWRRAGLVALAVLWPWAIWAIATAATGGESSVWGKLWNLSPLLILLALIVFIVIRKAERGDKGERWPLYALLLFFTAVLLTVGCELFYIGDIFNNRMNTVFRFYFQAWVLFDIASAFAIYYLYRNWKPVRIAGRSARYIWWGLLAMLVACSLIYSVSAVFSKTNSFSVSPTLDGSAWHQSAHPEEWEAISWMNSNIDGAPVIVTAPGYSYTDHGIVSVFTGLPTVLGWESHEYVWRGSDSDYAGRRDDIEQIYTGIDPSLVQELLEEYDVTYVYVGRLEGEMYGEDAGRELRAYMDVPYEQGGVVIYQVKE